MAEKGETPKFKIGNALKLLPSDFEFRKHGDAHLYILKGDSEEARGRACPKDGDDVREATKEQCNVTYERVKGRAPKVVGPIRAYKNPVSAKDDHSNTLSRLSEVSLKPTSSDHPSQTLATSRQPTATSRPSQQPTATKPVQPSEGLPRSQPTETSSQPTATQPKADSTSRGGKDKRVEHSVNRTSGRPRYKVPHSGPGDRNTTRVKSKPPRSGTSRSRVGEASHTGRAAGSVRRLRTVYDRLFGPDPEPTAAEIRTETVSETVTFKPRRGCHAHAPPLLPGTTRHYAPDFSSESHVK